MDLKPYICECCGGRINVAKMKCEYCGTIYENESLKRITIQTVNARTAVIRAEVAIPKDRMMHNPEGARDYTLRELRNQLADGLLGFIKIATSEDFMSDTEVIRGEVRVVDPMFSDRY